MKKALKANLTKPDTTGTTTARNLESGSKVAAENGSDFATPWAGRWSNLGADHSKRWEKRLYVAKSGGVALGKLAVRIQHLGQREEFRFHTTNRQKAALDALEVFRFLKANGWEATLAKFKPEGDAAKLNTTVGDFLSAVRTTNRLRVRTFLNYQSALRIITAEALGVKADKGASKFDYRSGGGEESGQAKWVAKIDARRLEELTLDKITDWKRQRVARAGHSPSRPARHLRAATLRV